MTFVLMQKKEMQQLAAYLLSFDSLRGEFMTALVNFIVVAQTTTTELLLY